MLFRPSGGIHRAFLFCPLKKIDQSQQMIKDLGALDGVDRVSLPVGEDMPEN
jgi:hypothetical protein